MVKKGPAIGSLNEGQKWHIEKLELVSFQEIGGGQIEPANAAIPVERDVGNWRQSVFSSERCLEMFRPQLFGSQ
jgi:hypothetical protein